MIKFNNPQMGITPQQGIMYRGQAAPAGKQGSYQPTVGIADALTLALSNKPGQAAGNIAIREGAKYGVANLGDNFYQNSPSGGRFTNTGGATVGALSGVGRGLLAGDDMGQLATDAGIGAARGLAGTGVSNYALDSGMSAGGASALGGFAGSAVGLIGSALKGDSIRYKIGPAFASGIGSAVLGPIGGAVLGKLTAMGSQGRAPTMNEDFSWSTGDPLTYKNGKWVGGKVQNYRADQIPEKYRPMFAQAHEKRANYMANYLNYLGIKGDKHTAKKMSLFFNNLAGRQVGRRSMEHVKNFVRGTDFMGNFNGRIPVSTSTTAARSSGIGRNDLANALRGLANGSHVMTSRGNIMSVRDYLAETGSDTGEGGDATGPELMSGINWNIRDPRDYDYEGNLIEPPGVGEE